VSASGTLRVKQVRSAIGFDRRQRATLRGLGLRRTQHEVEVSDTPAVRGMIAKVVHLIEIVEEGGRR
jgi:large subunit ribosomal protein L30